MRDCWGVLLVFSGQIISVKSLKHFENTVETLYFALQAEFVCQSVEGVRTRESLGCGRVEVKWGFVLGRGVGVRGRLL